MIVPDARTDVRFQDNPLVIGKPNIVFYAGAPLISKDGFPLGTICVIDHKPRVLSAEQINSLKALSDQTMKLLELRLHKKQLEKTLFELEKKNLALERFAYLAAHDLKSPLANISGLTELFQSSYGAILDQDGAEILDMIRSSSGKLKEMIDNLLEYSQTNTIKKEKNSSITIEDLKNEILAVFAFQKNCTILFKSTLTTIVTNKSALEQILINLISNAIKYNDKESSTIEIVIVENEEQYTITVSDDGPGILKENQEIIFDIFEVAATVDRFGLKGTGIGLATVKKIVEALGGKISVESALGNGAAFTFTLERS
jgi:signal transduction histidine kinase